MSIPSLSVFDYLADLSDVYKNLSKYDKYDKYDRKQTINNYIISMDS